MIYPPTGSANLLYLATNAGTMYQTNTGTLFEIFGANTNKLTLASGVTNLVVFNTVDCHGNDTSSSGTEHYAIRMTLNFLVTNYRVPVSVSNYYTFQTEMTPRTQN
jgi:hypothetical protein